MSTLILMTKRENKRPPEQEEILLLEKIESSPGMSKICWKYMPLIARYTGMRAGEIAQLKKDHFKTIDGVNVIDITTGVELKYEFLKRIIPISDKLQIHINNLLQVQKTNLLFPGCESSQKHNRIKYAHGFLRKYNTAIKSISIDLSFHCWRVYVDNALIGAEIDAIDRNRILGHSAEEMTQESYSPANLKRFKIAVDKIF